MPQAITDLFSTDENIWALGLIVLGVVFAYMIGKAALLSVIRRFRNRNGHA